MHELSVCRAMLSQVSAIAARHRADAVAKITLRIGPLSGVEPRLIRDAFPIARAGTVAERAELIVEQTPVRVRCLRCGAESDCKPNRLLCSACGDTRTQLLSGDELLLVSMDLTPATRNKITRPSYLVPRT